MQAETAVARAILQGMDKHGKRAILVVHGPDTNAIAAHMRLFAPDNWHERTHIQKETPTPTAKTWFG